jgi:hypothetical protein
VKKNVEREFLHAIQLSILGEVVDWGLPWDVKDLKDGRREV